MTETLKGKTAIVSGSSQGIGAAICVELASKSVSSLSLAENSEFKKKKKKKEKRNIGLTLG